MVLKITGAILIIFVGGYTGNRLAAMHKKEEKSLNQLIFLLNFMQCQLQYRLTPLPALCRDTAKQATMSLQRFFNCLAAELDGQISPNVERCVTAAIAKTNQMPKETQKQVAKLGKTLGQFDIDGQVQQLQAINKECELLLYNYRENINPKAKNYSTIGFCFGAVVAVILL